MLILNFLFIFFFRFVYFGFKLNFRIKYRISYGNRTTKGYNAKILSEHFFFCAPILFDRNNDDVTKKKSNTNFISMAKFLFLFYLIDKLTKFIFTIRFFPHSHTQSWHVD